jgi:glycerol-3-phosphate dehydrogenase (NAD(P)+)
VAGKGDIVATSNSALSRNFQVGYKLAQGMKLTEITQSMDEVAEGVNTVRIMKKCADYYQVRAPITTTIYKVLFEDLSAKQALDYLMRYPLNVDIDFID